MIIIGEKLNGAIPAVKTAIEKRDAAYLRELAVRQTQCGADYLDICAGTSPEAEEDTLRWMMDVVQEAVETPLCIDSPNLHILERALSRAKRPGLLNSISGESGKRSAILSLMQGTEWQVIAQTMDDGGIPPDPEGRAKIAGTIIETAARLGVTPDRLHVDPLVTAISADNRSALTFAQTALRIKALFPAVKITAAVSNISFGMPLRRILNQQFYAIAAYVGLDSALLDPCNRDLLGSILATQALLGQDRLCRNFTNAYRRDQIGPVRLNG